MRRDIYKYQKSKGRFLKLYQIFIYRVTPIHYFGPPVYTKSLLNIQFNVYILAGKEIILAVHANSIFIPLLFSGGLPKMDAFLRHFSHSIFIAKKKVVKNNFCYYINGWLLLFTSLIPLCALPSIWLGLLLACRWGRKPTLVLGSGFWILGACLGTWFPSASIGAVGMLFMGLGLGFTYQVLQ